MNNFQHLSTDELLKQFKEATRQGQTLEELVNELQRPGIAFINATDCAKVTLEKARAAISQSQKSDRAD